MSLAYIVGTWTPEASALVHPPKDLTEYDALMGHIAELWDEVGDRDSHPLSGLLETLVLLAEVYEEEHYPLGGSTTAEGMLAFLMEQAGLTQAALAETGFDSQGNISKLLTGKKQMNRRHLETACRLFNVPASVFI